MLVFFFKLPVCLLSEGLLGGWLSEGRERFSMLLLSEHAARVNSIDIFSSSFEGK